MSDNIALSSLIEVDVFKVSGDCIGRIDELLIDPYTGIIRSIRLVASGRELIKLPWSAMRFDKSRQTFLLTPIGEAMFEHKSH